MEVDPNNDQGLIAFDIHKGKHAVKVKFGLTPVRFVGIALSIVAAALIVLLIILRRFIVEAKKAEQ